MCSPATQRRGSVVKISGQVVLEIRIECGLESSRMRWHLLAWIWYFCRRSTQLSSWGEALRKTGYGRGMARSGPRNAWWELLRCQAKKDLRPGGSWGLRENGGSKGLEVSRHAKACGVAARMGDWSAVEARVTGVEVKACVHVILMVHTVHLISLLTEGIVSRNSLVKYCQRRKIALCIMKSEGMGGVGVDRVGLLFSWLFCPRPGHSGHFLLTVLGQFYQLNAIEVRYQKVEWLFFFWRGVCFNKVKFQKWFLFSACTQYRPF